VTGPDVDAYIAAAAPFARPILERIRTAFQRVSPEVTETLKWQQPFFLYRGGILAVMGAFKSHVRFHFWHASAQPDPHGLFRAEAGNKSGALKLSRLEDLPSDEVLAGYIKRAIQYHDNGAKPKPSAARAPKPELPVPPDLLAALQTQPAAKSAFAALSPSHRREYLEWILGAKRHATRAARIATAAEWLSQGKSLHWKYESKGASP
jgi:uncharacterized protein YdeI (YjbR/CyaY-like superfamily)